MHIARAIKSHCDQRFIKTTRIDDHLVGIRLFDQDNEFVDIEDVAYLTKVKLLKFGRAAKHSRNCGQRQTKNKGIQTIDTIPYLFTRWINYLLINDLSFNNHNLL